MLPEGMEYSIDGDVVDNRDRLIKQMKCKLRELELKQLTDQEKRIREMQIRKFYPAVKDAWEKYQVLLELHK